MSAFDLILNSQPSQFQDINSLDRLSDHDVFAGTSKITIPPIKKPRRKVFQHQKVDYESMKKDTFRFEKNEDISMIIQILARCKRT